MSKDSKKTYTKPVCSCSTKRCQGDKWNQFLRAHHKDIYHCRKEHGDKD